TGGDSNCDSSALNLPDYYGMFSYSWDKNGTDSTEVLKYWLDPDSTDAISLKGLSVSVEEPVKVDWLTIFPNPVMDQLTVKTSADDGVKINMTVFDLWGNLLVKKDWDTRLNKEIQLDMTGFPPGMYLLEITGGDRRIVRKIIKQ
ncbi:MAG: T9SS type A sorting domain-containing protein, partial [Bacteroidota bacterium]